MWRHGYTWAVASGRVPEFTRLRSLGSGAVDSGGVSGLTPRTAIDEVEEFLHAGPPLLVDLGVVGAQWKLDQGLGGDEGIVKSVRVRREERAGLAVGALLTLASVGAVSLLTDSGVMTHKYRGSIVVVSISKSVEPNEEQKVLTSGFQQGFTTSSKREMFLEF